MALVGLLLLRIFYVIDEKKRDFQVFTQEFSVGKASKSFIRRARAIGADEYSVCLIGAYDSPHELVPNGLKPSDSFVSRLNDTLIPGGTSKEKAANYEKHLDRLELKFEAVNSGQAKIQLTLLPPFLRVFCQISFKDGKVTENKVWQLD